MSTSNPNTKTNVTSDVSLNTLIQEALEKKSSPPKPKRTPSVKRKTQDQNSAEKTKPSKINNSTYSDTPPQLTQTPMMSNTHPTKPKMLRQDPKTISGIPCVSAHYTREAILTKDAVHPAPTPIETTYDNIRGKISNYILENKHKLINTLDRHLKDQMIQAISEKNETNTDFFNADKVHMINLANTAFQEFTKLCDSDTELAKNSNDHYETAKKTLATELTIQIPIILHNNKEDMIPFLTMTSSNTTLNKELILLVIRGANFDNKWQMIIHESMPTSKSGTSTHTLANTLHNIENETSRHQTNIIEIDNQITKISVRLGDLKTSELEGRHQQIENVIRLHNINSIDEGTPNHFRSLSHTDQLKRIHQLVNSHVPNGTGFSTQIISPNKNSKHFEALAIVTFLQPNNKYQFEKTFAEYRRNNPSFKVTSSRPMPQKTTSDRDIPDTNDIKQKIGMLYNQKVEEARQKNPNIQYQPLNSQEINAIQIQMKTKRKPFSTYWEFLCPTNNTTFMVYTPSTNPFNEYDFNSSIANPLTRMHATSDPSYGNRYPPKIYNQRQ